MTGRGFHGARLSVVIAAHNAQATIAASVRSVLGQTLHQIEVIVVDDGSTDATAGVVGAVDDPRVRLVRQSNGGPSAARNAGIERARGPYVAFLDSDDLWLPDYAELALQALDTVPGAGLAYTDAYRFEDGTGRVSRQSAMEFSDPPDPPPSERDAFLAELLKRNFIFNSTLVPAAVLAEVGGYDTRLRTAEDYHLWLRILIAGHAAVRVPGRHVLYRIHPHQASQDELAMTRGLVEVFAGLEPSRLPTEAHRGLLEHRRRGWERELAIVDGSDAPRAALRRLRHAAGRIRYRAGLGLTWYENPPPEVTRALRDLGVV